MKLALIVPGFSANEQDWCIPALLNYVATLAVRAEVHVFTLRWPERGGKYQVFGATVHSLDGRKRMGVRVLNLWARALRAMEAEHRRRPFDLLHAFWADEPGWLAAWAGARLDVPVVISLAGGELVRLRDIGYGLQLLRGRGPLIRWSLRRAARVTAGSNYLCKLARDHLPQSQWSKITYAPLGVDTCLFSPLLSPSYRTMEEGSGAGAINVGSLYPVKNHALLLRTWTRLPNIPLRLVGAGPLAPDLKRRAEGMNVTFCGSLNHADLPKVYRSARVFVQTSRHEAQGMALLEAAACGLPVVGTPVGVLPELGIVAPEEIEMAAQLNALWQDDARRKRLGENARAKVVAEYSLDAALERFVKLYLQAGCNE